MASLSSSFWSVACQDEPCPAPKPVKSFPLTWQSIQWSYILVPALSCAVIVFQISSLRRQIACWGQKRAFKTYSFTTAWTQRDRIVSRCIAHQLELLQMLLSSFICQYDRLHAKTWRSQLKIGLKLLPCGCYANAEEQDGRSSLCTLIGTLWLLLSGFLRKCDSLRAKT